MKLKLFIIEVSAVLIVLIIGLIFIQFNPYLESSKQNPSIGLYNQKEYARGNLTLTRGQFLYAQYNYSSYEPAILVMDITFDTWQKPGYLTLYTNGRIIATILATRDNPRVVFTVISFTNAEWVKPPSVNGATFTNAVTFESAYENGYEGTFNYQINIRGSL